MLDTVTADVGLLRGIEIGAYIDIMKSLAAGKYRDQSLGRSGIDYGGLHYTCFSPYDWRRDISEQADAQIRSSLRLRPSRDELGLPESAPVRVDVVAHSMGGLVLRYYLRYGTQPLPDDGSMPGDMGRGNQRPASHPDRHTQRGLGALARAGSSRDTTSTRSSPITARAFWAQCPRSISSCPEHATRVVDWETREPIDLYDIATWERYEWV